MITIGEDIVGTMPIQDTNIGINYLKIKYPYIAIL
jgi:hypothetical protein